jgi:hypothetical protein
MKGVEQRATVVITEYVVLSGGYEKTISSMPVCRVHFEV